MYNRFENRQAPTLKPIQVKFGQDDFVNIESPDFSRGSFIVSNIAQFLVTELEENQTYQVIVKPYELKNFPDETAGLTYFPITTSAGETEKLVTFPLVRGLDKFMPGGKYVFIVTDTLQTKLQVIFQIAKNASLDPTGTLIKELVNAEFNLPNLAINTTDNRNITEQSFVQNINLISSYVNDKIAQFDLSQNSSFSTLDSATLKKAENLLDLPDKEISRNNLEVYSKTETNVLLDEKVDKEIGKGLSDTNFTQGEKDKLAFLESSKFLGEFTSLANLITTHPSPAVGSYAFVDEGVGEKVVKYIWDNNDQEYVKQLGESDTLTPAQVKQLYEDNPDTNVFSDDEKTKLSNTEITTQLNTRDTANRARINHTGTQLANTISNFDTQVRTNRLDQMANPTAGVDLNSQRIINLANPEADGDAVNRLYTTNIQPQVITDSMQNYLQRTFDDSFVVSAGKQIRLEDYYKEIIKTTEDTIPDLIVHPDFSFDNFDVGGTKFYNAGNLNQGDGILGNFTIDWTKNDPIDFRPDVVILDRNITLDTSSYVVTDSDSITFNYWCINNSVTANDGYLFGNAVLGGQCAPRHAGANLRVSRHDSEILGVFAYTTSTTNITMLTFTYNVSTRLYRTYQNGIELFPSSTGTAGELDGDGRLRLAAGKAFTTGNVRVGNNSTKTQSFNGKLYEGFSARGSVLSPAQILELFDTQKTKYGL